MDRTYFLNHPEAKSYTRKYIRGEGDKPWSPASRPVAVVVARAGFKGWIRQLVFRGEEAEAICRELEKQAAEWGRS